MAKAVVAVRGRGHLPLCEGVRVAPANDPMSAVLARVGHELRSCGDMRFCRRYAGAEAV